MLVFWVLCVVVSPMLATASLPAPERSYNILMMLPACSMSERNFFMPLAHELVQRGHKVSTQPEIATNNSYAETVSKFFY